MNAEPASTPTRLLQTADGRLAYREAGSGPSLVFLHGGFLDHRMWEEQIRAFAPHYRVIAFDARGHGGSDNAAGPFRHADDVAALLRGLEAAPAVLVGVSMGGATAVDCALEHPELVRAVVVSGVGTSEPAFGDSWTLDVFAAQEQALATGDATGWVDAFMRFTFGPHRGPGAVDPDVVRRVREMALGTLGKHTPDEPDHRVPVTATWERAVGIAVPACAINGAVDAPDNLAMADRLMRLVPDGRTVTLPDTAHYPNMENPARFDAELASFLEAVSGNGASTA
ncbi:alpha/beta fold hydrolase [Streptomyces sp. Wb2n-11]|uniref:alpha/beta fold hydrolase n=1 Tax=Streptomyces sp. Wb2n-11 TaxID=1030533 RepID=UPI000B333634|nr:alpha/beta fold hydrolase [Streptomyces sp. Wb2n-11]